MIWDNLITTIKEIFTPAEKKEWLDKLVENLENQRFENINLPFKIVEVKDKGFVVKVSGLYAYISFNHMPWKYYDMDCWLAVSPKLIGKIFYCKVYKFEKEPVSIIINGEVPQFRKPALIVGDEYVGLIIRKTKYGVFVDIGYHFDWKCGSLVGLLHKSQIGFYGSVSSFTVGDPIKLYYQQINESGQLVFTQKIDHEDWDWGIPQALVGQQVWALVVKRAEKKGVGFLVNGKYKGKISLLKNVYPPEARRNIKAARNELKDGEIIHCVVTGYNDKQMILELNWVLVPETEMVMDNSIINKIDVHTLEKLTILRNEIAT